ncbi:hypothetical protein UG55_103170 [Frankia sp. EI5c]|uniref:hypothetical protein n=1 Tax=Frankia sp. EI5c TaxID=683316 RepID=UPI0007C293A7|nr:hypothetical protein [Frankia sp. EI5c]OAA24223.1 hypothetical protein UG55_103170 [Frankia sp. EI5c]
MTRRNHTVASGAGRNLGNYEHRSYEHRNYEHRARGRARGGGVRTWDEFTREERRTGLTVLAAIGIVAVVAVWLLIGNETSVSARAGAAAPPTVDVGAELNAWYDSTAAVRTEVARVVSDVRTHIAADDGTSLRPACVALDTAALSAAGVAAAPVETARKAWSDGAAAYTSAAKACGNLFDGTAEPVATLLARTTTALDTADGLWTRLGSDLRQPAQTAP